MDKIRNFFRALRAGLTAALRPVERSLSDERGDTNFISIAIILVVVIGIAIAFIQFGDVITGALNDALQRLRDALGI